MKKLTLVKVAALSLAGYLLICGYKEGPAQNSGWDCTGAETDQSNPLGCTTGGGCHASAATAGITVALELDSAGVPVTHYIGGQSYTIKLTGTNTTSSNLPAFGFQLNAIVGAAAQSTPTNAGTFNSPFPTNTHLAAPGKYYVLNTVEHGTQLPPTTGTGGTGTTYQEIINWTAPAAGTGTISIWSALNAVNDNGSADAGDLWNTKNIVIDELVTGIATIYDNKDVKIYPNPSTGIFNYELQNTNYESGNIEVYNLSGEKVLSQPVIRNSQFVIDLSGHPSGIYIYRITNGTQPMATGKLMVE